MTHPVMDLAQLDQALLELADALGANSLQDVVLAGGQIFQSAWRDNISAAGLVDTGKYLESISVEVVKSKVAAVTVQVGTDARDDKGAPYPFFLEYGTSDIYPHPVAQRSFDEKRRAVVSQVGADVERKVSSRVKRR